MSGKTIILVLAALLVTAGVAGAAGTAAGGDNVTIMQVEPETPEAPPGETVHVAVIMTSDGGYGDVGVDNASVGIEYDSDVLTLESVDRGPWMDQGNETEVITETDVDDEAGYAWIGQDRDPSAGGATGQERLATFTFSVAADAEEGEYDLRLTDTYARLTNEWPQNVFEHNGTLVVDEDASVTDAGPPASTDGDGEDGMDEDAEAENDAEAATEDEAEDEGDDQLNGFGVGVAALAILLVAVGRFRC